MEIRELLPSDQSWLVPLISKYFGSTRLVSRLVLHDALSLPGLVAEINSKPAGLLQYRLDQDQCEVVVLISIKKRAGVGRGLLHAVEPIAIEAGCTRIWLITTNNNYEALDFYKAVGWRQVAVHQGAASEARKLKPEIPEVDDRGTPIEDEIEFELSLVDE